MFILSNSIRKNIAQLRYDLELKAIELKEANQLALDIKPSDTYYDYYEAKRKNRIKCILTIMEGLQLDINHHTEKMNDALKNEGVISSLPYSFHQSGSVETA